MQRLVANVCLALAVAIASTVDARATADGPDVFKVVDVAPGDVLHVRAKPHGDATSLTGIPAGTDGIVNFGCIGGLSFSQWQSASEKERKDAANTRWCRVGYDRVIGWAAGRFLNEGGGNDSFRGGRRLQNLAGSEWQVRDFAGSPAEAEAWIAFKADGRALGHGGCNRFNASYEGTPGKLSIGPVAATRMACQGAASDVENRLFKAFAETRSIAATHLVLALFDADNTLLATLTRRDAD